jgi:GTP-binding protein
MTERYLKERETLVCLFVLVDSRIPPQKIDLEFFNKLGEWGVPFQIVFTKSDKVKKTQRMGVLKNMQTQLAETWSSMPDIHFTSSQTKFGLQQIEELILHYLSLVN